MTLTETLTGRLPTFDKQQLLTLQSNARRLQAGTDKRAREAAEMLPLIDAELAGRKAGAASSTDEASADAPKRAPRKRKAAAAPEV